MCHSPYLLKLAWSTFTELFVLCVTWQMWSLCIVMVKKKVQNICFGWRKVICAPASIFVLQGKKMHAFIMFTFCPWFTWCHHEWSFKSAEKRKQINKSPFGPGKEGSLSHSISHTQLSRSTRLVDLQGLRSWFFSGFGELLLNMNEIQLWKGRCDYEKLSFSFKTPFCSFSCVALLKSRNTFAFLCLLISIAPWWSISGLIMVLHAAI